MSVMPNESSNPARSSPPKKPWATPRLSKMKAGSAENGFSERNVDGQFTTS